MDELTLKALKDSIAHWKENCEAIDPDDVSTSAKDCALCEMFNPNVLEFSCGRCPVALRTGLDTCSGSPYDAAYDANRLWDQGDIDADDARAAFRAEYEFLVSLLPEGETP